MSGRNLYEHLEPRPGSRYRQWDVKGRKIRAVILASQTNGEEARTPEEVAGDYGIPVAAVLEAIDYCRRFADVVREDAEREEASLRARGLFAPPFVPADQSPKS